MGNFVPFFSHDKESEKEEGRLESMLTLINDNFTVGYILCLNRYIKMFDDTVITLF